MLIRLTSLGTLAYPVLVCGHALAFTSAVQWFWLTSSFHGLLPIQEAIYLSESIF